jgi:Prolipoprotein diacylglyceryl transferase
VDEVTAGIAGPGLQRLLDRLSRRDVRFLGRSRSAFRLYGGLGLLTAAGVAATVALAHRLPPWTLPALMATGVVTFLSLAMATKMLSGQERLVYYHHEIAVLLAVSLLLRATGQSLAAGLDVAALGLGAFLACGRIGCLSAGCCHGRPARWGVRYGAAHVERGLPSCLVGVRLFPLQLVEAPIVAGIVTAGLVIVVAGGQAGAAAELYIVAYALLRFVLELFRGDPDRRYVAGLSEAQWTGVLVVVATAALELTGALPRAWSSLAAALLLVAVAVIVAVRSMRGGRPDPLRADHLVAIAHALERLQEPADRIEVAQTPGGLRLSLGSTASVGGVVRHCSLSRAGPVLRPRDAHAVAPVIVALLGWPGSYRVIPGGTGVYHVVSAAQPPRPAAGRARGGLVVRRR